MKLIRFRLLIAMLAVLLGSAIAKSQTSEDAPPPPPMHGHAHGMPMWSGDDMEHFLAAKLNLTDDQKKQAVALLQKEHPTMQPLFQQQHQLDIQLRQYVEGNYDEAKVQALATQKAQVQQQITIQQTRIHNEVYQLLTPEQRDQLKQLEAERDTRIEQRMQHHAHMQPPSEQ